MSWIIDKYRKEVEHEFNSNPRKFLSWRFSILEAIFKPTIKLPPGKGPMTHLHPDMGKLHLPHGMYLPDWRKYKVEDHPILMNHQKRCHAAGLHDPWLRNYAYKLYPNMIWKRSRLALFTQQCGVGFVIAAGIYTAQRIYRYYYPAKYIHSPEYVEKYGDKEVFH